MKRIIASTLGLTVLLAMYGVSCTQPKINCTTGHGGFAMKYTLKEGSKTGMGDCDTLKGDVVGLEKYNPQKTDDLGHQDFTKALLAMRTQAFGDVAVAAASVGIMDNDPHLEAVGDFSSADPDEKDVCMVPKLSDATQKLPAFMVPAEDPKDPPTPYAMTDRKLVWSNIRVYATTNYPGTQLVGEMTYTDNLTGCSASYTVMGLYPAVSCKTKQDCAPEADPDAGRATGSGINPDLPVDCDPVISMCMLTALPEALR